MPGEGHICFSPFRAVGQAPKRAHSERHRLAATLDSLLQLLSSLPVFFVFLFVSFLFCFCFLLLIMLICYFLFLFFFVACLFKITSVGLYIHVSRFSCRSLSTKVAIRLFLLAQPLSLVRGVFLVVQFVFVF